MNKTLRLFVVVLSLFLAGTSISPEETIKENPFSFKVSMDTDLLIGTSKILSIVELGPNMTEETARVQGQLITLFGEPAYTTQDLEQAYGYVMIAKARDGKEFVLTAYSGASGPAIGGDSAMDGITEAAESLRDYILSAQPADYEYEGYCLDIPVKIHQGVRDGQVFYSETLMSDEEFQQAWQTLFPDLGI